VLNEVELECLPKNIPEFIEVDLSNMHVGDIYHLSDLKLPAGVEILALKHGEDNDSTVASMHVRKVAVESEEGEEAREEGEADKEGSDND